MTAVMMLSSIINVLKLQVTLDIYYSLIYLVSHSVNMKIKLNTPSLKTMKQIFRVFIDKNLNGTLATFKYHLRLQLLFRFTASKFIYLTNVATPLAWSPTYLDPDVT